MAQVLGVSVSVISDLKEVRQTSQPDYTNAINSWQSLVDMNKSQQQNKFNNFISEISDLHNNMNQVKMIIEALTSSMETNFYIKDIQQKYILCSNTFLNTVGLKSNYKPFGKTDTDFFSINEAKINTKQDAEVLIGGKSIKNIEMHIPGSRKKKWGFASKYPVIDINNNTIGLIGIFIDITEKKKTEEKNDMLIKLLDTIPYSIGAAYKHDYFFINKACEIQIGYSREEIIQGGNELIDKITHYTPDVEKLNKEAARIGEEINRNNIARIFKVDGNIHWIHNIGINSMHNNKKIGIGISRDYTEEQQKEVELASYQQMLEQLSKKSNDIFWGFEFTKDGKILPYFLNDNFERLTGYLKKDFLFKKPKLEASIIIDEEFKREPIFSIIHPDYHFEINKGLLNKSETEEFEFKIITKDAKLILLVTSVSKIDITGVNISYFGKAVFMSDY